jgi:hypothetical protein
MTGIGLARGISGVALPTALAIAWWRRRNQAPGRGPSAESPLNGRPSRRTAPGRRELRMLVRDEASLTRLDLRGASLAKSDLSGRNLAGSDLSRARLAGARLCDADLAEATLDFADLSGSDLRRADLSGASLLETSLYGADLRGADMSRCRNLIMANLRRATYDTTTRWPGRLDARTLGAIYAKTTAGPGPQKTSPRSGSDPSS